jgi:ATP-dependent Zn protease
MKWTKKRIDAEIAKIINLQMERSLKLVRERHGEIERLSKKLLERDVLSFTEVNEVLGPRPFKPQANFQRFLDEVLGKPNEAQQTAAI